jgi:hypothetical protein
VRGPWAYKGATSRRAEGDSGRKLSGVFRSTRRLKPLRPCMPGPHHLAAADPARGGRAAIPVVRSQRAADLASLSKTLARNRKP